MDNLSPENTEKSMWLKWAVLVSLWMFTLASAVSVVYATFQARKATQELEALRQEAVGLQIVSGQFMLEKSSWGAYSRVEKIAKEELGMISPPPGKTVLVFRQ